jgi:hypothetical protein
MSKALSNFKVFAAASVLFALASFYNLNNSSALTPGMHLTVIPPTSDVVVDAPTVASSKPAPRS